MKYLLALLAGFACCGAASAQEQRTYRCKVTDVVTLADNGRLDADNNPQNMMRKFYDGAIIDTLTGAVTYRNGTRRIWKIVKKGGSIDDHVLVPDALVGSNEGGQWSVRPTSSACVLGEAQP
jgi:hypothetical protein